MVANECATALNSVIRGSMPVQPRIASTAISVAVIAT
jgi:hypothetical protein